MPAKFSELENRIRSLLGEEPGAPLRQLLERSEPVDIAAAFFNLSVAEQQRVLGVMDHNRAAAVLVELDDLGLERLVDHVPSERIAHYVALMEPDDAADVVGSLGESPAQAIMEELPEDRRTEIGLLLTHGPETAGGIMDPDVVEVRHTQTVAEAIEDIRSYVKQVGLDDFFSVFVVDETHRLVGVVPNWKMMLADPAQEVRDIMIPDPVSVEVNLDQEEVSMLVRDHDLVTIPVVDAEHHLIGRITVDDIVDVIQEEHSEDLAHLTGTGAEDVREVSIAHTLRDRAPWLFIALAGQFVAAVIMRSKQEYLVEIPQLAFFIPAVMAMGGNTGVQSASLVIRGLATGEVRLSHFRRRLLREFLVALSIGSVFAVILVGGGFVLTGWWALGMVVGLATLVTITVASTGGMVIPMVLRRLGKDPALATGPFLTTLNDVFGIAVYLLIAYIFLFYLGLRW
ncbi:MAG: magnesium transporter [bacterium]